MFGRGPLGSSPIGGGFRTSTAATRTDIAKRVRGHRIARAWTQQDMATRAGISFETYRRFERTGHITLDRFLRILDVLRLLNPETLVPEPGPRTIDDVLGDTPKPPRQRARSPRRAR